MPLQDANPTPSFGGFGFTQMLQDYKNTPRKCLGYRTPAEIFLDQVLHLKCESRFPPSRE